MRRLRFESLLPSFGGGSTGPETEGNLTNAAAPQPGQTHTTLGLSKVCLRRVAAARKGRGKSELHRAGCLVKAGEGPVVGPDSPDWRPLRRARATETNATHIVRGVKRAILPAAISETTAASSRTLCGWAREVARRAGRKSRAATEATR